MPKCNKCGEEVEFKSHPQNPNSQAPFNLDGEIHFATCGKKDKYNFKHQGVFSTIKIKDNGSEDKNMTTSIVIDSLDLPIRIQNLNNNRKIFIEINGEAEWKDLTDALLTYRYSK